MNGILLIVIGIFLILRRVKLKQRAKENPLFAPHAHHYILSFTSIIGFIFIIIGIINIIFY